jgi:enamine deaminase RidA (YjgF/YER057c/UK114 family)
MSDKGESANLRIDPGWPHFANYAFSPAIARDGWLFVSGMTASGPGGTVLHGGDIVGQTDVILERLGEVLRSAGCDYVDVVMTRDYIVTTDNYRATADVRRKYFSPPMPAATGVIVAGLLRPGALIEIEVYARLRD